MPKITKAKKNADLCEFFLQVGGGWGLWKGVIVILWYCIVKLDFFLVNVFRAAFITFKGINVMAASM